ncbi:remodeling and spacing factor 1 [Trichomycterus rosablanca]|uniref:remodeling and spacing factor 1 n=1 Tax=Trichomycterus rosablanca TaxID=2290929 RepID=UPI002F354404
MAAPGAAAGPPPGSCASFAVVCSFLERYGVALDLPDMTFPQLEAFLQETSSVPQPLIDLHVKLLRKLGKSVTHDKWEKYLVKVCQECNSQFAWELERKGYPEMSMNCKADILKYLCECQFDENMKFKMAVNEEDPDQMRLQPIGKDEEGLLYWFQLDQDQNVRLYVEEQDDLNGSSWRCIVRSRNELADILERLKAKIEPEVTDEERRDGASGGPGEEERSKIEEKGSSGLKTACKEEGEKQRPLITKTEIGLNSDSAVKENQTVNVKIKKHLLNNPSKEDEKKALELKEFGTETSKLPQVIDNRVSTIKSLMKDEPKDSPQHWNAISVVMAPGSIKQELPVKPDASERAMKSDQQAKIPLKKRNYTHVNHNNNSNGSVSVGGIIVPNPAVLEHSGEKKPLSCSPPTENPQTLNSQLDKVAPTDPNKRATIGVIMGPIERFKTLSEPEKNRNGIHGEQDVIFKTELTENIRQSVVVTKPDLTQATHHASISEDASLPAKPTDSDENGRERVKLVLALPKAGEKHLKEVKTEIRTNAEEKIKQETPGSSTPKLEEMGSSEEPSRKRKAEESLLTEEQQPAEENRVKGFKRKKRSDKSKLKMHLREDEEASSELQKEGIRLKITMHRRSPGLRRSNRICKPSPKLAEIRERKHTDQEEETAPLSKDGNKKTGTDEPVKPTKAKRRHRRPRWTKPVKARRIEAVVVGGDKLENESEPDDEKTDPESEHMDQAPPEDACKHCRLANHPELILLCDMCDSGYHTACLRPPLMIIPDGEWFCPPCQHKRLCEKLEEQLQNLDSALKKRDRAERRRERLVYVGISVENIIPNPDADVEDEKEEKKKGAKKCKNLERRSTRKRKSISYRFDDFDDAIDEAIEEDFQNSETEALGHGKKATAITDQQEKEEAKETRQPAKTLASRKRKHHRRLNDLDSESTPDEEESEEEFHLSDSMEEKEFVVSGDDDGGSDADADAGSWDGSDSAVERLPPARRTARNRRAQKTRRSTRRSAKHDHPGSSEEEEEDEEEIESEGSSEFSDSDVNLSRRRSRRSQKAQINYCENSESEGSPQASKHKSNQPPRPRPRPRRHSSSNTSVLSKDSEPEEEPDLRSRRRARKKQSTQRDSKQRHKRLLQAKSSSDEEEEKNIKSDGDEGIIESEEEERPLRRKLNRIETDEEEDDVEKRQTRRTGSKVKDLRLQSARAPPKGSKESVLKHNGLPPARPSAQDEEDEEEEDDDPDATTDFVNFVFDSEQLS